jgi:hypothetical protein
MMRSYIKVFIAGVVVGAIAGYLYSSREEEIRGTVDARTRELRERAGQTVDTLRERFRT